jgi:flavin reductase (DIM6/NTAB) family NADH-FMN oxidoreductase RutF
VKSIENLAPFSWFNIFTNYPPFTPFECNQSALGRIKDTIGNLKNSQGFSVDIIREPFVENENVIVVDTPPRFDRCK